MSLWGKRINGLLLIPPRYSVLSGRVVRHPVFCLYEAAETLESYLSIVILTLKCTVIWKMMNNATAMQLLRPSTCFIVKLLCRRTANSMYIHVYKISIFLRDVESRTYKIMGEKGSFKGTLVLEK